MTTALSIRNLHKTYKGGFVALKGIDLDVSDGDFFALLGPNGAGKSTMIGIITSLVNKTSGKVQIFDKDMDEDLLGAKRYLGLVPQEFNFSMFEPVEEIIINQAGYYGIPRKEARMRTEKYLKLLDLWGKRRSEARILSGGMKRRMMIARAMVHEPRMLILDEPTAGVDIEVRRSMWQFLQEINDRGTTIILTTHYLEEAENLCRNIAIIDQGEIIKNTTVKELLTTLHIETFVLDLVTPINSLPEITGLALHQRDAHTLELTIDKSVTLNQVFEKLSAANIEISSLRNKSGRLEELFIQMVGKNNLAKMNQA
ncbi:MAG TPA: ABC transporter ATP-binding protein [Chromatiales bacterium]|nr:ABC transporter ATP-binding protein [Thiotrichales bacterium]HIP67998.1 ABC transporter ATP-binding protein [Chromatiales bacterium]